MREETIRASCGLPLRETPNPLRHDLDTLLEQVKAVAAEISSVEEALGRLEASSVGKQTALEIHRENLEQIVDECYQDIRAVGVIEGLRKSFPYDPRLLATEH